VFKKDALKGGKFMVTSKNSFFYKSAILEAFFCFYFSCFIFLFLHYFNITY